ncbi:nucleocapsid N [American bat vesiculovirus]|uniref:Nucleoprotein n=1 Tax=American bat vesiculovirus TaxID=1972564 RepID=U3LXK0_9RHAB|nr:nucleocapsid N [American bat vesiculovirus]AGO04418.1 nucleocapsid N [American bat vesiculovirus]
MNSRVRDVDSQKVYSVCLPAEEDPVEYPSEYFTRHKTKPVLFVSQKTSLEDLRQYVYQGLRTGEVYISHVVSYLYMVLKEHKETNGEKWVSFEIQIADKDEEVSPFCPLIIKEDESKIPDGKKCPDCTIEDDKWLPTFLLGLYRIGRATIPEYRALLMKNLMIQCKNLSHRAVALVRDTETFYDGWGNNPNFCKEVAAIDMFYHRFKKSDRAVIRFGTIVSRYKDCAALSTFAHLNKVTGMSPLSIVLWLTHPALVKDFETMMKENQEIDKADSYMPYLIDMGLSRKSPYSSVKNSSFHFWGQMTALLARSDRAKNARVPSDIPKSDLTTAAWIFGYAISRTSDLKVRLVQDNSTSDIPNPEHDHLGPEPPSSRDCAEWMAWWVDQGGIPTADMKSFGRGVVSALTDLRAGSVGKFAKAYFEGV